MFSANTWGNTHLVNGELNLAAERKLSSGISYIWAGLCLNEVKGCFQPVVSVGNCQMWMGMCNIMGCFIMGVVISNDCCVWSYTSWRSCFYCCTVYCMPIPSWYSHIPPNTHLHYIIKTKMAFFIIRYNHWTLMGCSGAKVETFVFLGKKCNVHQN